MNTPRYESTDIEATENGRIAAIITLLVSKEKEHGKEK